MENIELLLCNFLKKLDEIADDDSRKSSLIEEYKKIVPQLYEILVTKSDIIKEYEEHKKICKCTSFRKSQERT